MQNKRIGLKRKNKIRRISLTFGILLFLFVSLVLASHHPKMIINNISIAGNSAITERELVNVINKKLEGRYFKIFPKSNIFLYSKERIKSVLLNTYNRIYFVDVEMSDFKSISIEVKERKPYVIWCEEIEEESKVGNPNECYFLDNKGYVFTKAPIFSNDVYFIVFGKLLSKENDNISTTTSKLGYTFLGENRFTKLMQLRDIFAKEDLETIRLRSIDHGDFEFYLTLGGKLIFNEDQDMEKLFNNLTSAIEAKNNEIQDTSKKVEVSEFLDNIDYIDLRFDNKVLFKFLD